MSENLTPERSCYFRMTAVAAGIIGAAALFGCMESSDESPEPTPREITVITTESPSLAERPIPTATPRPPIPVAPLPPEDGR